MGYQTISIPFGSGVDTKTDPKMLAPPKVVLLQDGIFTNAKRITKRNGNDIETQNVVGGQTWSSPTMVKSYNNQLLLAATVSGTVGPCLLSYSEQLDQWQNVGSYQSIAVSRTEIGAPGSTEQLPTPGLIAGAINSSCAIAGNFALYAYDTGGLAPSGSGLTFITVVDQQTGARLASDLPIVNALAWSKVAALGTNVLAVFYISSVALNRLAMRIISITTSGVSIGSEITVGTCTTGDSTYTHCYDITTTASGCVISWADHGSTAIRTALISTSGVVGTPANLTTSGNSLPISNNQDSSGQIWVYWSEGSTNVKYGVYSSALATVLGKTSAGTATNPVFQLAAISDSTSIQTIYVSQRISETGFIGSLYTYIYAGVVDSSGVVSGLSVFQNGVEIYGKPISINSRNYLGCISFSSSAATCFLIDTLGDSNGKPFVAAKFLQGSAEGLYSNPGSNSASSDVAVIITRYPGFINSFQNISSTIVAICAGFVVSISSLAITSAPANAYFFPSTITESVAMGYALMQLDFNHIDAYQGVEQQDTLVLNGSIVSQFDSASVTELGFLTDPDGVTGTVASTGGTLHAGTYAYWFVYQWVDSNGNLHQSAPSLPVVAYLTESGHTNTNVVTIQVNPLFLTEKYNVKVLLYRSLTGGSIGYLIKTTSNPTTLADQFVTFTDDGTGTDDSVIQFNPTLYTEGGAILENIAPPPAMILWSNNNRVWAVDSERPETTIEYTKTASLGSGISFSTGFLELVIDSTGGDVSGASRMDEKTVILKKHGVGYFIGDGLNDAGTGSTITSFQFVPSSSGCSNSKSVLLYPNGILFRATNNKGIYLISRGVQVSYFGYDVEAYNSQDILSAVLVPDKNQIRFLTSLGDSLLYDYVFNQWSAFTNYAGLSADQYNGLYVYVRSSNNAQDNGALFIENRTTFLDNVTPFAPLMILSWIKSGSIQGFQRCRRFALLGDHLNANGGHGVQVSVAYDFNPSFSLAVPYYFNPRMAAYQYRERMPRMKCDSFQMKIQEIVTGASGEYIDFSDLGLELLLKDGLNKLPANQTVG